MKVAYIGTPALSAAVLEKLIHHAEELGIEITNVITQPDMPVGRKQIITQSPVKVLALQKGLPVSHDLQVLTTENTELALLFAFGMIIPQKVLDIPTHGFWNIHPSLLPSYRGASPITFPILLGEKDSGVTLMQMDADLDHGPIIEQVSFNIPEDALRASIEKEVVSIAFRLISNTLARLSKEGNVSVVQQNHELATFTRPLEKNDGYLELDIVLKAIQGNSISKEELPMLIQEFHATNKIDYSNSPYSAATAIWDMYRALHGWPGVWTKFTYNGEQKRLKLLEMKKVNNLLQLVTVQIEGKNPVDFATFSKAYSL